MTKNKLKALFHLGAIDAGHPVMDADSYDRLMYDLRRRYEEEDDSVDQERMNLNANGCCDE